MDVGWNTIDGNPTLTGNKDIDWILNLGDWKEDLSKFPNGLKEVFDEVHRLGKKPGLWISVATAKKNAKIYRFNPRYTGCSAKNHAHHRDREESYLAIYVRLWQLFDELHQAVPDLYIDCTFENGHWDGFQRINTETGSGGIVGIFRQGSAESSRTVTVKYLKPTATYSILSFPDDKEFGKLTGKELLEKGFQVKIENKYDGRLFEIRRMD